MYVKKHLIYIHLHDSIPCFVHPQHSSTKAKVCCCWKIMKRKFPMKDVKCEKKEEN